MRRIIAWLLLLVLPLAAMTVLAQYSDTGVTATAQNTVNVRAYPNTSTDDNILGQMSIGEPYVVVGQHEIFPWLLLADQVTLRPVGWVYEEIVQISGSVAGVPFYDLVVNADTPAQPEPSLAPAQASATPAAQQAIATSTPALPVTATPVFTVAGNVQGEINLRYGPAADFPRVGVARAGDRFQITAYNAQVPWVQIRYEDSPNGYAWVAQNLLDIEGDIFSLPAISSSALNLPPLTPTSPVIQSQNAGGLTDTGTPLSSEFITLGNQLFNLALTLGFDPATSQFGSLYIRDLQTDEAIAFGNNVAYSGTSVNKIAILVGLYGVLDGPPPRGMATDIANTMICSENTATNRLIAIIGEGDEWQGSERITEMMRTIGMNDSFLLSPYTIDPENPPLPPAPLPVPQTSVNQQIAAPEPYNQMTVEDMGLLLSAIYQCGYEESGPLIQNFPAGTYEPRECRQMVHVMANNTVDGLLKTGAPPDTRVAHKHGWINDTHTNAGIFFTDGGDYVAVMALHSNRRDATGNRFLAFSDTLPLFAESGRQIYNYYNPDAPQPQPREGFIPEAAACNFAGTPLVEDLMSTIWDQ